MKKIVVLFGIVGLLMTSCSVSKVAREKRNLLSGTWILEDVSYENNTGNFSSILFNDAKDICFEGSNWFFRDNNSTGRYTIAPSTLCNGGDRYIRWSVVDRDENYTSQLQFKFIDAKNKDIDGGLGYRLNIDTLTPTEMILKSNNQVDGEQVTIVYQFTKK
ncbi:lipocalin family protein [Maribacter polysiphoniae]|uniref:Lipocalin family protein n=1 Tax=Maribacter polysiphoniae TaxID=429344 RepID=A0A316DZ58_9FLAO|nr:lipocalin family protein [Maribacter polysiphoniae]MBD1261354.1 lipocalin family protein [Maribacter polysiphoniae]PWK23404.1 lipocalin-like protein [Maribacter polysiphoniae]